jgi:hypothetical protein
MLNSAFETASDDVNHNPSPVVDYQSNQRFRHKDVNNNSKK